VSQYQNKLGQSRTLNQANAVTNQYGLNGAEANWVTVFESPRGANEATLEQYNVQTFLGSYALPAGELTQRKLAILGRIQWGVGGVMFQADFDWKLGNQLSVLASFVSIMAAFSETTVSPAEVVLSAGFGSGGRASRAQVTRTFPQLHIAGGDPALVVIFPIPPFAHALNLFATDQDFYDTDEVTVRFVGGVSSDFSSVTTDLASFISDAAPFRQALATEDGVRFPESAKFVEVSTSDEAGYNFTPTFTLNL
jgi:hypothetical protein